MVYEIIVRIRIWQDFEIIYENVRLNKTCTHLLNRKTLRMSIFVIKFASKRYMNFIAVFISK